MPYTPKSERTHLKERIAHYDADKPIRARVLFVQDQIILAVYHKRPQFEIDSLMDKLRNLTQES
jgi:hypothetical protein